MFSVVLVLSCIQAVHKIVKMNDFLYLTLKNLHRNFAYMPI